jgi:hypothetical protein
MIAKWLAGLLGAALVPACTSEAEGCPGIAVASVGVIVTDSASGERICDATVSVRTAARDYPAMVAGVPCSYVVFSGELDAEHTVMVSKTGFQTFIRTVFVREGQCGLPETQTIEAELQPQ